MVLSGYLNRKKHEIPQTANTGTNYAANRKLRMFSDSFPFTNPPLPQTTPTHDGSGQVVHPSVIYFPNGWGNDGNGDSWKYWLVIDGYKDGNRNFEKPNILVCNDGESWQVPAGLTNPIDDGINPPYSDPDIFYDEDSDQIWVYYRYSVGNEIWRRTSSDGITWSDSEVILDEDVGDEIYVNPCVLKVGSTYYMWTVTNEQIRTGGAAFLARRTSVDGVNWSASIPCTFSNNFYKGGTGEPWHLDIIYNPNTQDYLMLLTETAAGVVDLTENAFARSDDGLDWYLSIIVIPRGSGNWDHDNAYRGSIVIIGNTLHIWYSGSKFNGVWVWRMGYISATFDSDTGDIIRKSKADLSDIRFTETDDTLLNQWLKPDDYIHPDFYVKITDNLSADDKDVYIYYNNPSATSVDDAKNTFNIGDDFNDTSIDGDWTQDKSGVAGTYTISEHADGYLKITKTANNRFAHIHQPGLPDPVEIITKCRAEDIAEAQWGLKCALWFNIYDFVHMRRHTDRKILSQKWINGVGTTVATCVCNIGDSSFVFFKMTISATIVSYYYSRDGVNWIANGSVARDAGWIIDANSLLMLGHGHENNGGSFPNADFDNDTVTTNDSTEIRYYYALARKWAGTEPGAGIWYPEEDLFQIPTTNVLTKAEAIL